MDGKVMECSSEYTNLIHNRDSVRRSDGPRVHTTQALVYDADLRLPNIRESTGWGHALLPPPPLPSPPVGDPPDSRVEEQKS